MNNYKVLISTQQIEKRVGEIAQQISNDYGDSKPVIICMLKGAVFFFADICKKLNISYSIDFARLSSYKSGTTSGQIEDIARITTDITNRPVIIVEDIVDSGKTLDYFINKLKALNPKSIKVCSLLDKPSRRVVPVQIDYLGFTIEDKFIVGYGLDLDEQYRELPYVAEFI